jgi:hypothetical protein
VKGLIDLNLTGGYGPSGACPLLVWVIGLGGVMIAVGVLSRQCSGDTGMKTRLDPSRTNIQQSWAGGNIAWCKVTVNSSHMNFLTHKRATLITM